MEVTNTTQGYRRVIRAYAMSINSFSAPAEMFVNVFPAFRALRHLIVLVLYLLGCFIHLLLYNSIRSVELNSISVEDKSWNS